MESGGGNYYRILVTQTNERVWQLIEAMQSQEALEVAQGTLERARKYLPVTDKALQDAIYNLATVYFILKEYDMAEPLFRELIEVEQKINGPDSPFYSGTASALAKVYWLSSRYAEAQSLLERALDVRRRKFSQSLSEAPHFEESLQDLANFYQDTGRPDLAQPLLQEAEAVELWNQHRSVIDQMNAEVQARVERGEYQAMLELAEQAEAEARQWLAGNDPFLGSAINNLATVYFKLGRYDRAEPLFEEVLALDIQTRGPDDPQNTASMSWLAELYQATGRRDKAEDLLIKVLDIRRRWMAGTPQGEAYIAMALDNLTAFYRETGQPARAGPLQAETDAIYSSLPADSDSDALQIHQAISLHNSAIQDQATGSYDLAEQKFLKALEIKKDHLGAESVGSAETLQALAGLYKTLGRFTEAEPLYRQALAALKSQFGPQHPEVGNALFQLAAVCIANGKLSEEVLNEMVEAAQIETDTIDQVFSMRSERERLAYMIEKQGRLSRFVSLAQLQEPQNNRAVRVALDIVLQRKGLVLETQALLQRYLLTVNDPNLRGNFELLRRMRQNLFSFLSIEDPVSREASIRAMFDLYEKIEAELARQIPGSLLREQISPVNHQQIAWGLLPDDAVLVEIVRIEGFSYTAVKAHGEETITPPHYLAFTLPARKPEQTCLFDLGEAEKIERLIYRWRSAITGEVPGDPARGPAPEHIQGDGLRAAVWNTRQVGSWPGSDGPGDGLEEGIALRQVIFDPLLKTIGGTRRLFIATDGEISLIPYEALPLDQDRYILDEYEISYLSTGRDLFRFGPSFPAPSTPPVVIADPNYDFGGDALPVFHSNQPFNRLEGVRPEGQNIASRLGVTPLLGDEAVETALINHPSPAVLHLATHGFFAADLPATPAEPTKGDQAGAAEDRIAAFGVLFNPLLRSGLALAGANLWAQSSTLIPAENDGILTAEDILGLDLYGTELVVLSACETGLGEVLSGEGVFGLRRAFAIAGSKTIVMSLWKVPDKQTLQLMDLFYGNLLEKGLGRAEALRQAQLSIRRQYPKKPFYWGAFICQGDPGPLPAHPS